MFNIDMTSLTKEIMIRDLGSSEGLLGRGIPGIPCNIISTYLVVM